MDRKQWFKDAKFGMMIHFGLYSLLAGEWKGKRHHFLLRPFQLYGTLPQLVAKLDHYAILDASLLQVSSCMFRKFRRRFERRFEWCR